VATDGRKRGMGLISAISIGVGGMIGAGIFSILGVASQTAGAGVWLSFIVAGVVALLCTYSFARLGITYPSAGGPVEFLVQGLGDNVLSGGLNLLLWIGYIFALALYARAFGAYASTFISTDAPPIIARAFGVGIVLIFASINLVGARAVGRSEVVIVAVKVAILAVFAAAGLFFASPGAFAPSAWPAIPTILVGAGVVFLAYEGFGLITNAAEDMASPGTTLPRALYLSVISVMVIYVAVSLAVIGNLPIPRIVAAKDYALAAAAKPFLGNLGFRLITVAALFSTSSAINATLYGGANVSYTIAREGELPPFFERTVWKHGTEGLLITTLFVIIFAIGFELDGIAMMGSASFLVIYAAVNVAHLRLLNRTGARRLAVLASLLGNLAVFAILVRHLVRANPKALWTLGGLLVACFLFEWAYRRVSGRAIVTRHGPAGTGAGLGERSGGNG
jgi:amino acid transporter